MTELGPIELSAKQVEKLLEQKQKKAKGEAEVDGNSKL